MVSSQSEEEAFSLSVLNSGDCIWYSLRHFRSFNPYLSRLLPFHLAYVAVLQPCSNWGASGESTRLPPMWPGFKVIRRLVCFGSLPRSEGFLSSGYVGYLLSLKTSSKFQFTRTRFNEVLKTHNCSMSKQITVTKLQLHGAGRNFTQL